jgi:hypothetical protein
MLKKICSFCKKELDLDRFTTNPMGKLGRRSECRICSQYKARIRHRNPEAKEIVYSNKVDILPREVHSKSKWRGMRYSPNTGMMYSPSGPILALTDGYRVFGVDGKTTRVHRFAAERLLSSIGENMVVDHINRNPLDNRITNLRIVNRTFNNINSGKRSTNSSGYKGVIYSKADRKWRAVCQKNHLGSFDSPEEAALAYNKYVISKFGEDIYLNSIEET